MWQGRVALLQWGDAGTGLMLITRGVYFAGMFVCTLVFNVPLNNALAGLNRNSADVERIWSHYLKTRTRWNHLRTVSSTITCLLSVWLLSTE
jgi:uncharacterized membrane protein